MSKEASQTDPENKVKEEKKTEQKNTKEDAGFQNVANFLDDAIKPVPHVDQSKPAKTRTQRPATEHVKVYESRNDAQDQKLSERQIKTLMVKISAAKSSEELFSVASEYVNDVGFDTNQKQWLIRMCLERLKTMINPGELVNSETFMDLMKYLDNFVGVKNIDDELLIKLLDIHLEVSGRQCVLKY